MRKGYGNVRDATTRPSSRWSDGSSMAISADQTEGKRMQRRAKTATRKAMNMTSMGGGGMETPKGWWWLVKGRRQGRGGEGGANSSCTAPRGQQKAD